MEHTLVDKNGTKYIAGMSGKTFITAEQDILDFIAHCGDYPTNRILLYEDNLTKDFFDLKTQLAGKIMQKLANYSVKAAVVISARRIQGRFGEMARETKNSGNVRYFTDQHAAEVWLIKS